MRKWLKALGRGPFAPGFVIALVSTLVAIQFEADAPPEYERPPGASFDEVRVTDALAPHDHSDRDVTFVVLEGEGRLLLDGRTSKVEPGLVLSIPRGSVHSLEVTGEPIRAIRVFSSPAD